MMRKLAMVAAVASSVAWTPAANATFVTVWDYSVVTQFSGVNTFSTGTGSQVQTATQVSWGDPSGDLFTQGSTRSGITISDNDTPPGDSDPAADPITGVISTNAVSIPDIGLGAWLTHHNNPISVSYAKLLTTQIESTLTLQPNTPLLPGQVGPSSLFFTVFFSETPNDGNCVAQSPPNNGCNDIFAINSGQAFNQSFTFDDQLYFVSIFPLIDNVISAFPILSDAECAAAGASAGCVGFSTVEGQDTSVRFGFAVTGEPIAVPQTVPEPGSLALILLTLASAGLMYRRLTV